MRRASKTGRDKEAREWQLMITEFIRCRLLKQKVRSRSPTRPLIIGAAHFNRHVCGKVRPNLSMRCAMPILRYDQGRFQNAKPTGLQMVSPTRATNAKTGPQPRIAGHLPRRVPQ
jgi:hypothetical protein